MEIKFKRLSDKAIMPIRAHKGDAGVDLTATNITTALNEAGQVMIVYHTDLAVEIPEGYVGLLFPRSSIWEKTLTFTNCVGVVDAGYRGEIKVITKTTTDVVPKVYNIGERFCQLVIVPIPEYDIVEATELNPGERGDEGFGSTGNEGVQQTQDETYSAANGDDKAEEPQEVDQSTPTQAAEPIGSEVVE